MMKRTMLCLAAAVSAATASSAIDFNNGDVIAQSRTFIKEAEPIATPTATSVAGPVTIPVAVPPIQLQLKPAPDGSPTDVVGNVWIKGEMLHQDDGGYIPKSVVHLQGYEFVAKNGILSLKKLDAKGPSILMGTFDTNGLAPFATIKVQPAPGLKMTLRNGPAGACEPVIIDSEPQYAKTAESRISFEDASNGQEAALTVRIGTTMTPSLDECEQTPLGNNVLSYP